MCYSINKKKKFLQKSKKQFIDLNESPKKSNLHFNFQLITERVVHLFLFFKNQSAYRVEPLLSLAGAQAIVSQRSESGVDFARVAAIDCAKIGPRSASRRLHTVATRFRLRQRSFQPIGVSQRCVGRKLLRTLPLGIVRGESPLQMNVQLQKYMKFSFGMLNPTM